MEWIIGTRPRIFFSNDVFYRVLTSIEKKVRQVHRRLGWRKNPSCQDVLVHNAAILGTGDLIRTADRGIFSWRNSSPTYLGSWNLKHFWNFHPDVFGEWSPVWGAYFSTTMFCEDGFEECLQAWRIDQNQREPSYKFPCLIYTWLVYDMTCSLSFLGCRSTICQRWSLRLRRCRLDSMNWRFVSVRILMI